MIEINEKTNDVINHAIDAVELYSNIANLLMDVLHTLDTVNVGSSCEYELKLMCVDKLKSIVEKIEV